MSNPTPPTAAMPGASSALLAARPPHEPAAAELAQWRASVSALEASLRGPLSTALLPPREHARLAALAKAARSAQEVLAAAS